MTLPDGSGLPIRTMRPDTLQHYTVQEWPKECDKELKVSTWTPKSPDPNPIKHLWDKLDQVQTMVCVKVQYPCFPAESSAITGWLM